MMQNQLNIPCLPPNTETGTLSGKFTIKLKQINFIKSQRPIKGRILMWGQEYPRYIQISTPLIYQIHTTGKMLGQYFRDARNIKIDMIDQRNNQQIGYCLVNLLLYLKKKGTFKQQQSPFFEQNMNLTIDLVNRLNKKIGEILFTLNCQILPKVQKSVVNNFDQISKQSSQAYSHQKSPILQNNLKNYQFVNPPNKKEQTQFDRIEPQEFMKIQQYKEISKGNTSKHQRYEIDNFYGEKSPFIFKKKQIQSYQLELIKLKLDAKEILSQKELNQNIKNKQTIEIYQFIPNSKSKQIKKNYIQFIDVYIRQGSSTNHCRIYPIQQTIYKSIINASKSATLEIILGQDKAKNSLTVDTIIKSRILKLPMLGPKENIIGYLKIISHSQQQKQQIQNRQSIKPKFTQVQIKEKKYQQKIEDIPKINQKLLLIYIKDIYHAFEKMPIIVIKDHKWEYPYSNYQICNQFGTIIGLQIRSRNGEKLIALATIETYGNTPIIKENIQCTLVFDGNVKFKDGFIHICLEIGNIKQINYSLNNKKQTNMLIGPKYQPKFHERNIKQISQQNLYTQQEQQKYNKQINIQEKQRQNDKRKIQKIYTQTLRRVQTQPISQYKLPQGQQSENKSSKSKFHSEDDIFIVQILSKALHVTTPTMIQNQINRNGIPQTRTAFIRLWSSILKQDEPIITQILADMFIDQNKVNYQQFIKCIKSYHSFLDLWWSLRAQTLTELLRQIPDADVKIERGSQLGIIRQQSLFKNILTLNSEYLKSKINRIYHISSNSPLQVIEIILDLGAIKRNEQRFPIQSSSSLISDLAKILKQTVQQLLVQIPIIDTGQTNINSLCLTFQKIGISISYWESIMLIEEIKGWYNTDLELPQGLISSSTIIQWIKIIVERKSKKQTIANINKSEKIQKKINQDFNNFVDKNKLQNKYHNNKPIINNTSRQRSQINESQIWNIANLLKQNDQLNNILISQKNQSNINKNIYEDKNYKILQNLQLDNSHEIDKINKVQYKYLQVQFNSIKFKNQQNQRIIKITIQFSKDKFAIYHRINETDNKISKYFCQKFDQQTIQKQTQGLSLIITNPNQSIIYGKGILPIDDILDNKKRTIVLYDEKNNINGKIVVIINILDQPKKIQSNNQINKLILNVVDIKPKIKLKLLNQNQIIINKLQIMKYKIQVKGQLYNEQLIIEDQDGLVQGIIPLEQLFFRNILEGKYPLLNKINGQFIGYVLLKFIKQQQNQIHNIENDNIYLQKFKEVTGNVSYSQQTQKYFIFFDQLVTFGNINDKMIRQSFRGNILLKNILNDQIIFKSQVIEHQFGKIYLSSTKICNCWHICPLQNKIRVEFINEAKILGTGIVNAESQQTIISIMGQYFKNNQITIRLKIRIFKVPSTNYNLDRIGKSLSYPQIQKISVTKTQSLKEKLNQLKQQNKLTFTQINIVEQIIKLNKIEDIFYIKRQQIIENIDFMEQLLFHDDTYTGFIETSKMTQLLQLYEIKWDLKNNSQQKYDYMNIIYQMVKLEPYTKMKDAFQQIEDLHRQINQKFK